MHKLYYDECTKKNCFCYQNILSRISVFHFLYLQILIVNNKACSLLGYSSTELCNMRISNLLKKRSSKTFSLHEAEDADISEDGTIILLSGKVCLLNFFILSIL